jgi:S1-C subfamily serine protease
MSAGELPRRWIPSQASMLISSLTHDPKAKSFYPGLTRRNLQGDAKIEVAFAKSKDRFSAKNVRSSDRHDVSLLKVDVPFAAKRVEINDNYDSVNEGDSVVVMGYPGVAPKVAAVTKSQDMFNERSSIRGIVLPSVTSGVVMTIVRSQNRIATTDSTYSFMGDLYQLALNTTGSGNSGGPVLDSTGRAIAIYNSGISDASGTRTSGAVPIRYGVELMRVNRVQR